MQHENSTASYSLKYEQRPDYLYVLVEGDHDSYEISKQYWMEVLARTRATQNTKLLIEEDIPEAVSMFEMFQLASDLIESGLNGLKIAFVDRYLDHDDLNKFGELVAINRGANARAFDVFSEAEEWLISG